MKLFGTLHSKLLGSIFYYGLLNPIVTSGI